MYWILYVVELAIAILSIIIGIIIFKVRHKNGLARFIGITIVAYILTFVISFILEKPEINIDNIEDIEAKSNQRIENIKVRYHFKDISNNARIKGNIDYDKIGVYNVEVEVDTFIGAYKKRTTIRVVDTTKPELTLEGGEEYKQSYSTEYKDPGFKAIDNYDGDITNKVITQKEDIDEKNFNIKYEISDVSGNKTEKVRKVTIVDDVPPQITLNGEADIILPYKGTYEEKGATAQDEIDGDLTGKIIVQGTVNSDKEGTYSIVYIVADSSGNEAKVIRNVIIKKQLAANDVSEQTVNGDGVIYLTFDDGPSSSITPHILDILKSKNVKATFFILNYDSQGEQLIKREYDEGHTVAIHGYSHEYNKIYQSEEAYMENITKLQEKIKQTTGGYVPTITRFPGGSSNTVSKFNPGIMTRLTKLVVSRGYKYFDWNVSSGDAGGAKNSQDVYNNVVNGLKKDRPNVVLMHDFASNQKTLNALEHIIDYGIQNGYTFSRITESTPMVTHNVNN